MYGFIDRLAAWFGIRELDFRLARTDKRRLAIVSGLPALVLIGDLLLLYLQAFQGAPVPGESSFLDGTAPETSIWERLYYFTSTIQSPVLFVAVALLFIYAIPVVPRPQACWALLIAVASILLALFFGLLSALPRSLTDSGSAIRDWYAEVWVGVAIHASVLAIGYAFLAYRGLSVWTLPRRRRLRVPPSQPREL